MSSRSSLPSLSTNSSSNSPSTPTSKLPRSNSAGLDLLASPTRDRGNDHPYGIISTSSALLTRSNSSSSGAHSPAAGKNWTRGHQSSRSLSSLNTNDPSSPMPFPLSPSFPSVSSSPSRPSANLKRSGTLPNVFPTRPKTEPHAQPTRSGDVRSWTHQDLVGWMREKLKEEGVAEVVVGDIVKWLERAGGGGSIRSRRISGMGMDGREFLKGDTGNWSTASPPPFLPLLLSLSKRLRRSNLKSRILSGNQREISDTSLSQHGQEGSTLFEEDENAELSSEEDETSSRGVKGLVRGWEERSSASEAGSEDEDGLGVGGGGRRRNLSTTSSGPRGSLPGLVRKRAESMNDLTFGSPTPSPSALLPAPSTLPIPPSLDRSPPPQQDTLVESPPLSPSSSVGFEDAKVDLVASPPPLESLIMQPCTSSTSSGAVNNDLSPPPPPYRFPPTSTFEIKPLPTPPLESIPPRPISTYSEDEEAPHLSNMSHLVRTGSNPYGALRRGTGGPNKPGFKFSKEEQDASNSDPRPSRPAPFVETSLAQATADEGDDDEEEMFEGRKWNEGGGTMRRVTARPRSKIIDSVPSSSPSEEVLVVASSPKPQPAVLVEPKQAEEDQISLMRTMMGSMSERITVLEGRLEELLIAAASSSQSTISAMTTAPALLTATTISSASHSSTDDLSLVASEPTTPTPARRRKGTQRVDSNEEDEDASPSSRRPERDMHYVLLASMGVGIIFLEIVWRRISRGRA